MLTDSQRRTLDFIQSYILRNGHSPTYQEIVKGIGISSVGSAHRYVKALVDQGYLLSEGHGTSRSLKLTDEIADKGMSLPLLGKIAAGQPIEAIPGFDSVNLNQMLGGEGRYALKVSGDSMIELGILDGDTVIIEACKSAAKNAVVVALIDNYEVTLKIYQPLSGDQIKLTPANPDMEPMVYPAHRVQVQAVLVGSMRTY